MDWVRRLSILQVARRQNCLVHQGHPAYSRHSWVSFPLVMPVASLILFSFFRLVCRSCSCGIGAVLGDDLDGAAFLEPIQAIGDDALTFLESGADSRVILIGDSSGDRAYCHLVAAVDHVDIAAR